MQADRERPSDGRAGAAKNTAKIFEKTFQKPLDKPKRVWYNNKVARKRLARNTSRGSLTIEQQEIKVQAKLAKRISKFL